MKILIRQINGYDTVNKINSDKKNKIIRIIYNLIILLNI